VLHNESVSQVQTLLALLEAVMLTIAPQPEARSPLAYERQFVYCLAWSIGGLLDPGDRRLFDAHLRSFKREAMPQASHAFQFCGRSFEVILVLLSLISSWGISWASNST